MPYLASTHRIIELFNKANPFADNYTRPDDDNLVLTFDWRTRRLVYASPRMREVLHRIGVDEPDGRPANSLAWSIARYLYPGDTQSIARFYRQQEHIQEQFEADDSCLAIETSHSYRRYNLYYDVRMVFYLEGNKWVIMEIFPEVIEQQEFDAIVGANRRFTFAPNRAAA